MRVAGVEFEVADLAVMIGARAMGASWGSVARLAGCSEHAARSWCDEGYEGHVVTDRLYAARAAVSQRDSVPRRVTLRGGARRVAIAYGPPRPLRTWKAPALPMPRQGGKRGGRRPMSTARRQRRAATQAHALVGMLGLREWFNGAQVAEILEVKVEGMGPLLRAMSLKGWIEEDGRRRGGSRLWRLTEAGRALAKWHDDVCGARDEREGG